MNTNFPCFVEETGFFSLCFLSGQNVHVQHAYATQNEVLYGFSVNESCMSDSFLLMIQDDREFRDKITPISVTMEYSLDYRQAADKTGLLPIVNIWAPTNVTKQVHS